MNSLTTATGALAEAIWLAPEAVVSARYTPADTLRETPGAGDRERILGWLYAQIQRGEIKNRQQLCFALESALLDLERRVRLQLNRILHHPRLRQLEASWCGLQQLVETRAEYDEELTIKIKVLNTDWASIGKDLAKAIEFDQSHMFQRLYSDEFDTPGGEPFGVIIGDYYLSHRFRPGDSTNDIETLKELSNICAAALCPFIAGADASLFGLDSFAELSPTIDLQQLFSQAEYRHWKLLREHEASRFIGLTLPRILMRKPYEDDGCRLESLPFTEQRRQADTDYVWGNACYAFGSVLMRAFANTGWFADIRGGVHEYGEAGVVRGMNYSSLETDPCGIATRAATNIQIDDLLERDLSQLGFIPLCSYHSDQHTVFYSNCSVYSPTEFTTEVESANERMSAMIQYMLCVSRFGHYLKVIGRDRIGSVISAQDCQRVFQDWLNQYTAASDGASSTLKARYPLAESRVDIREQAGKLGSFICTVYLKPHFQLDHLVSSIKLVTELNLGQMNVSA